MKLIKTISFILLFLSLLFILACGGGSSYGLVAKNGTVAMFLADGLADDY
jgi:hypothetical protein